MSGKTLRFIALLCGALLLGGCASNSPSPDPSPDPSPSPNQITVASPDPVLTEPSPEEAPSPLPDVPYVIDEGPTEAMIAESRLAEGNKVRLAEKLKKAQAGGDFTVAYIGGSITQGSSAGPETCYSALVTDWFETTFPNAAVQYVNAGIGATGSYIGVHRADGDVLAKNPDIVFVEFSVNDTTENTERNINSYDSLLRKLWLSPSAPALVAVATTQESGNSFQAQHAEIAAAYDLPFVSYRNAILYVIDKGYIVWDDISDDDIHPNVTGHKVLSELIISYLEGVNAELDAISGEESDFSVPHTDDKYQNARLIRLGDESVTSLGMFEENTTNFGNFAGTWRATVEGEVSGLVFEVEAKNIAVFFGKLTKDGGLFEVIIDGEQTAIVDTSFPGGWGNYVEVTEVASYEEPGAHTVEIRPVVPEDGAAARLYISSLAVS
ncbi:MAG: SGNH/GDSL hydrolase family protein [Oscillospiraceae bacterium]|jgi:lysophospholipase L1-like esterase|nr:SGNH/GDSL hydrolase family protein [Oscillospiraceae bacterium]